MSAVLGRNICQIRSKRSTTHRPSFDQKSEIGTDISRGSR